MTDTELAALKALADAATPGPWRESAVDGEQWIAGPDIYGDAVMRTDDAELSDADAAFIAAARTAVPWNPKADGDRTHETAECAAVWASARSVDDGRRSTRLTGLG